MPELIEMFERLVDVERRPGASHDAATYLGSDDLMIFCMDPELGVLLPAPGFPQTFPEADTWEAFIADCHTNGGCKRELISTQHVLEPAVGRSARDGTVIVLLGGSPSGERLAEACELLPMAAMALRCERRELNALGQLEIEQRTARDFEMISTSLANTRRELQNALLEARQAIKVRDDVFSAASHDLRDPIHGLSLTAYVLLGLIEGKDTVAAEELAPRIERMQREIARLTRLVDLLLDVSKISSGQLALQFENFDLPAMVDEVADWTRESSATIPISINAVPPFEVRADKLRLELVLNNLLSNAVKYGGGQAIELAVSADDEVAFIRVTDHGMGIASRDQDWIFGRFQRVANGPSYQGLGMGLWISRRIVEQSGGKLSVSSALGQGSTFTIAIPRSPEVKRL